MTNWDKIQHCWNQFRAEALQQWARLTDSDWDGIAGCKDKLVGKLQKCYNWGREDAEAEVDKYFGRAWASPRFQFS